MGNNSKVNEKRANESKPNGNKIWILVLLLLIIVVIVVVVFVNRKSETSENTVQSEETEQTQYYREEEGTKINTSSKLSEIKEFEGLEISNVTLTEEADNSTFIAAVKNNNNSTSGEFFLDLKFVDKDNNEIATISCYVDKVEPGQSVELNASATANLANAYDYSITKQAQ